ncbi:MAG: T9SS type A sorting domain-containing protein [Crocinitomicaceae bacterium]
MSRILLVASAIFFLNLSFAQINVQWESRYNGTGNFIDQAVDLELDASGNTYVTGTSYNGSSYDWVTVKYDSDGNEIWTNVYGGSGLDEAAAIVLDGNNDVIVTGSKFISGSDWDLAIQKIDGTTGVQAWEYTHTGSTNFDGGKDITVDSNNDVIVAGTYSFSTTDIDYLVVKVSSAGVFDWSYTNGTTNNDEGKVVLTDASNNIYVAGHSNVGSGTTYFDVLIMKYAPTGGAPTNSTTQDAGFSGLDTPHAMALDASGNIFVGGQAFNAPVHEEDYVTMKFNNNCVHQWTQTYSGDAEALDRINAIAVDQVSGNVFVTGRSKSLASSEDYYTIAYDNNGAELWNDRYTSSGVGFDEATDIQLSGTGFVYLTGYSYESATNNDYTTLKYDDAGNFIWDTRFNGPSGLSDQAVKMQLDPSENIFVTGASHGGATNLDYSTIKYCQLTTVASNDTAICAGQSVDLTATGGINITWAVFSGDAGSLSCTVCGTTTVNPTSTTVYTVSSESASGCIDYDTVTVVVNSIPSPVIYNDSPLSFCTGDSVTLYTDSYTDYLWSTSATDSFITVYSTGTYTVTITDLNGCVNSTNASVTAFALPNVDAGASFSICPGDSEPLNATGATTYLWDVDASLSQLNIPNPTATPTADTWYYVTGTDGNGCENIDSLEATLYTLPVVNAGLDDQVCSGDTIQLNASGALTYAWNASSTLSSLVIPNPEAFPSSQTTYVVTGTDGNGCTDSDDVTISTISLPGVDAGPTDSHCIGDSTQLFATGALNWVWVSNPDLSDENVSNPWVSNSTDGWFYVSGTDVNNCTNVDSVFITVDALPMVSAGADFSVCTGDSAPLNATGANAYQWDFHPTFTTATNIANPSATPITQTTYSVTGTNTTTGCSNSADVTVSLDALPIIDAGPDTSMCIGDSLQLMATGGTTYIWEFHSSLSSNIVADPWSYATSTITYYVDAYDANSCFGEDSVMVTVNPLPGAPIIVENGPWLISSYSSGNQWYYNGSPVGGETNDSLNWVVQGVNGQYTLLYTDDNGCSKFSEVSNIITVDDIGFDENPAFEVKMYPNPTNGLMNIELIDGADFIQIIALNGQLVMNETNIASGITAFDLSHLEKGVYMVQLVKGEQVVTKRIIVQ